jgi:hypothetical protein
MSYTEEIDVQIPDNDPSGIKMCRNFHSFYYKLAVGI